MKKLMGKSIFAAIAMGLLSISYVSADTVDTAISTDDSVSTKTLKLGHNFKNVEPRMDGLQWRFHDWPMRIHKRLILLRET